MKAEAISWGATNVTNVVVFAIDDTQSWSLEDGSEMAKARV